VSLNHQLTKVIGGRTVTGVVQTDAQSVVQFDDGSRMTVKTTLSPTLGPLGKVTRVRQQHTTLNVDLDNDSTLQFTTVEPMASVMVRDKNQTLEYMD